ncbi:chromate transporter [Candidatus Chlorohelix sp.]|uniref:chromate transporter n=1 Tax=Candidatus Chlorohelix sp. TaxID=3139201 RepID=UPI003075067E
MNPLEFFLTFLKASLFSTDGLGNLPSLHQDLLANGIATDTDFSRSVALGQISPGPNGLWALALGYFTYGILGVILAFIAIIIPPFIVLLLATVHRRIEHLTWVKGLMRGVSLAVVGLFIIVIISLVTSVGLEWKTVIVMIGTFGLSFSRRVNILLILGLAALGGYLLY